MHYTVQVVKPGPESGQLPGTTITIELEDSDAPISRQQMRMDLSGLLPTAEQLCDPASPTFAPGVCAGGFADEEIQQKVRDVREIVSACDTLWRHGKHDDSATQAEKVRLEALSLSRSCVHAKLNAPCGTGVESCDS